MDADDFQELSISIPSRPGPSRVASQDSLLHAARSRATKKRGPSALPLSVSWDNNDVGHASVVQNSARPALITQLTGSSTSSKLAALGGYTSPVSQESSSLMANLACGVKVVGDMLFDPVQMKWLNISEEEEEDVFANIDEDETSESGSSSKPSTSFESTGSDRVSHLSWDQDSTIRARRMKSIEVFRKLDERWSHTVGSTASPRTSSAALKGRPSDAITRALETGVAPPLDNVDDALWRSCIEAEKRHRTEIKGFFPRGAQTQTYNSSTSWDQGPTLQEIERPRPHLYYLQKVARDLRKARNLSSP